MLTEMTANNTLIILAAIGILLDVASGILKAWGVRNISSSKMREGLQHKMTYVIFIAVGFYCDALQASVNLGVHVPTGASVCVFVIASELVSISENMAACNPKIANWPILRQLASVGKILDGSVSNK